MPQNAMHEDHLISKKCDSHAHFSYSTRGEHPGCHLKKGETMHLLTENATVSHS